MSQAGPDGPSARRALAAAVTFLVLVGSSLMSIGSAAADSSAPGAFIRNPHTWYAYVAAGESLSAEFGKIYQFGAPTGQWDPTIVVTRPDGSVASECTIDTGDPIGTRCSFDEVATTDGVWAVDLVAPAGQTSLTGRQLLSWDVTVGDSVPGRVWTERYVQSDQPVQAFGGPVDLSLFYLTEQGYIYAIDRLGMNGIDSAMDANAFGVVDPATCTSAHSSTAGRGYVPIIRSECDYTPYKIFFSAPAADLPTQVTLPNGQETWLRRPALPPTIDSVAFLQRDLGARSGDVRVRFDNFEGNAQVFVDTDGDGADDGALDRVLAMPVVAGEGNVAFDGLNAKGEAIPATTPITFRVRVDGFAEVHFTDTDVESRADGVRVNRLNGPDDGTRSRIFWDDTFVTSPANDPQAELKCSTTPAVVGTGVDSTPGVHGWGLGDCSWTGNPPANAPAGSTVYGGTWGNNRNIDDWATIDIALEERLTIPAAAPALRMSKASDPATGSDVAAGRVVAYTLTYQNLGTAPDVVDSTDDLARILDDADLTTAPASDSADVTVALDGTRLRMTGSLAPGATAHVTYAVTVRPDGARGDNLLDNALVPDDPAGCLGSICTTNQRVGELETFKTVDPGSGTTVPAGGELTYTLHFANVGTAPVAVDQEDVLADVLDDAEITSAPVSSDPALTVGPIVDGRFPITGTLDAGRTATVTYRVTVGPDGRRGNDTLHNVLVPAGAAPACRADARNCTVNHASAIALVKSSDPVSGTPVAGKQEVTYTLTLTNMSRSAAATPEVVDYTDRLADVLDDATLDGVPTSSSGSITPTVSGDDLRVTGSLAPGETATVEYTVIVKPYAEQGDHRLRNVVALTGTPPVCVPGNGLCTTHPTLDLELGRTGAEPLAIGAIAGAVVLAGLGVVLAVRRTRRRGTPA